MHSFLCSVYVISHIKIHLLLHCGLMYHDFIRSKKNITTRLLAKITHKILTESETNWISNSKNRIENNKENMSE